MQIYKMSALRANVCQNIDGKQDTQFNFPQFEHAIVEKVDHWRRGINTKLCVLRAFSNNI